MMKILRRFWACRDGVALIELVFVMPFMILLFVGGFELVRYIILLEKVEKAAYALANITAQFPPASTTMEDGEIDEDELRFNVFPQLQRIMAPYSDRTRFTAIITSLRREDDQLLIKWQMGGGGSMTGAASVVNNQPPSDPPSAGVRDSLANLPTELAAATTTMMDRENMIVAEVFYRYQPILSETLAFFNVTIEPVDVHRWLFLRPRNGDLICLPTTFTYPECSTASLAPNPAMLTAAAPCFAACGLPL